MWAQKLQQRNFRRGKRGRGAAIRLKYRSFPTAPGADVVGQEARAITAGNGTGYDRTASEAKDEASKLGARMRINRAPFRAGCGGLCIRSLVNNISILAEMSPVYVVTRLEASG